VTNNGFCIGWLDLLTPSFTVALNYNRLQQLTVSDDLRLAPFLTGLRVSPLPLWLTWFWFTNRSLLRNSDESLTNERRLHSDWLLFYESVNEFLVLFSTATALNDDCLTNDLVQRQSYFTTGGLPPIASSWRQLNTCGYSSYVTSSLTRRWVYRLQLLLVSLAQSFSGQSPACHDQILLSQILDSPNLEGQVPVLISPRNRHWLPFSSPRTTRRATMEVFDPSSTRGFPRSCLHGRFGCLFLSVESFVGSVDVENAFRTKSVFTNPNIHRNVCQFLSNSLISTSVHVAAKRVLAIRFLAMDNLSC
jgi:hypothetical protein